jgi:hypothetical protein
MNNMVFSTFATLLLISQQPAEADAASLTLVKDGRSASVIVTNGRPKEGQALAAAELQEHLHLMTGAKVPVVQENELPPGQSRVLILVGQSNLARKLSVDTASFEPEAFIIRTSGNVLLLAGDDGGSKRNARTGTLWAVYDFLQDQLGCRWIWPGEIGRVVPRRRTVTVGNLDIRETPRIKIRHIRMVTQEKHRMAYREQGLERLLDLGETYEQVSEDERTWLRRMHGAVVQIIVQTCLYRLVGEIQRLGPGHLCPATERATRAEEKLSPRLRQDVRVESEVVGPSACADQEVCPRGRQGAMAQHLRERWQRRLLHV